MMMNEPRYCGAERHMRGRACQGREEAAVAQVVVPPEPASTLRCPSATPCPGASTASWRSAHSVARAEVEPHDQTDTTQRSPLPSWRRNGDGRGDRFRARRSRDRYDLRAAGYP